MKAKCIAKSVFSAAIWRSAATVSCAMAALHCGQAAPLLAPPQQLILSPSRDINNGSTMQFSASGLYADGMTLDLTNTVQWTATDLPPGTSVASVTAGGLVTARELGRATIGASYLGLTASSILTVDLLPGQSFGTDSEPHDVAVGDFNGDGKPDLATANGTSVSVLLGDGTGHFGTAAKYSTADAHWAVAIGDFNGDGKLDLATTNPGSSSVSVLLGDGIGHFGSAANFNVGGDPYDIAVGDFNGDGKLDLATANLISDTMSVLLGDGTGKFGPPAVIKVGSDPRSVVAGDFNRDGKSDLAVANNFDTTVSVLLGDGTGNFGTVANYNVGRGPEAVAVGDFNGDGKLDLATGNTVDGNFSMLLGDGTGKFGTAANIVIDHDSYKNPSSIAVGDFNGDGKLDLAAAYSFGQIQPGTDYVSVLLGDGTGNLSSTAATFNYFKFDFGSSLSSLAVADFNGDGRPDFVAANSTSNQVTVRLN